MEQETERAKLPILGRWENLFLNIGSDPTQTLTRAYIFALVIIAILSIGTHFVTSGISESQKDSTLVAYQLNNQRTQMHQILIYADSYHNIGDPLDLRFVFQSMNDLKVSHQVLMDKANETNITGAYKSLALQSVYFNPPFNLAQTVNEYNNLVAQYLENNKRENASERESLMKEMNFLHSNKLQPAMDVALSSYQREIIEKIERFNMIQLVGVGIILFVLLAEAVLIFRPLIARIRTYNKMMKRYALEDVLTGLKNRRAFLSISENELLRASREKYPISVALMDLDHFKSVNDTYGHDVGDLVLKHFSRILEKSFRAGDVIGRIGGEEFAIFLPKANAENAEKILEKLCRVTEASPCPYPDKNKEMQELSFTVSVGYITLSSPSRSANMEKLLKIADEALYETKENGRNGVTKAPEDKVQDMNSHEPELKSVSASSSA